MAREPLRVLFLAAEAVPFAKVGGLADVAGALPKALRALGHDVRLMLPRYGTISSSHFDFESIGDPFTIPTGSEREHVHLIGSMLEGGLPAYLIWSEQYFSSRDRVYGFEDDAQRFAVFGRGALGALRLLDWKPDVIHANDWHTGIVPTWLSVVGRKDAFYRDIATLFTIHNLAYQGVSGRLILTFAQMEDVAHLSIEEPGTVNWMAQGIAHADVVNTVSEQYASEILTQGIGMGLAPLLQERRDNLFGVLNGIDCEEWDPSTDTRIPLQFSARTLDGRVANKTALQQQARLPVRTEAPLVGMVSRLDRVKGIDLMEPVLEWLLGETAAQFVLLGTGRPQYHDMLQRAQARFPGRMHAFLKFDDALARLIYAGSDMFLMPSEIEPCGLGQMIAMRYGSVPVVRRTGGLADTVKNATAKGRRGTGFTFDGLTSESCQEALARAIGLFQDKKVWRKLQQRSMAKDFSWAASARKYVDLYRRAIENHGA